MVNETAFWREQAHRNGHYNGIPEYAPTAKYVRGKGKTNAGNTTNYSSPNTRTITF